MKRRRNLFSRNIWGLLFFAILIGIAANYFFMHKKLPTISLSPTNEDEHYYAGPLLDIQTWQTTRGLKVFFLPIETLPILDIQLIFTAGSAYDGLTPGIAQLTNQLIGKNTTTLTTNEITENFENIGAIFNTHVNRDAAVVALRTLSFDDERTRATNLFADILKNIAFTQSAFSLEKQQALTSLAAQAQSPQAQSAKTFYELIYGTHPYATATSGNIESVNAMTLENVQAFYHRYYHLQNASMIIVGDVTTEEAQQLAENLDHALPEGVPAEALPEVTLPAADIFEHVTFPSTQQHILIGLPTLEKNNPDFYAFYLGNEILGGSGLSSQLFDVIREQEGLAYSVSSQIITFKQKGPFIIALQTRNDSSDIALAMVQEHLDLFIKDGPSQKELEKAKQNISGQFLMAFQSNAAIAQHVGIIAFYQLPIDYYDHYLEKINAVTLDDIKRVFTQYVGSQHLTTVTLGPNE